MLTMYVAPHDRGFATLRSANETCGGVRIAPWGREWSAALDRWDADLDASGLDEAVRRTWATPSGDLDSRVERTVLSLAEGEALDGAPATLAAAVGISGSRLAHLVKEHTGSSIGEVQRAYRFVHAARSMLAEPSFTRAAHAAGFSDSAHFSRSFRAAYGIAPSRILASGTRWAIHDRL